MPDMRSMSAFLNDLKSWGYTYEPDGNVAKVFHDNQIFMLSNGRLETLIDITLIGPEIKSLQLKNVVDPLNENYPVKSHVWWGVWRVESKDCLSAEMSLRVGVTQNAFSQVLAKLNTKMSQATELIHQIDRQIDEFSEALKKI